MVTFSKIVSGDYLNHCRCFWGFSSSSNFCVHHWWKIMFHGQVAWYAGMLVCTVKQLDRPSGFVFRLVNVAEFALWWTAIRFWCSKLVYPEEKPWEKLANFQWSAELRILTLSQFILEIIVCSLFPLFITSPLILFFRNIRSIETRMLFENKY